MQKDRGRIMYLAQFKMMEKLNRLPEDKWGTIMLTY